MGQKVNPTGLRLGVHKTWDSKWFASKREYANTLHEDLKIREYIFKGLKDKDGKSISDPDISRVEIIRYPGKVSVNIYSSAGCAYRFKRVEYRGNRESDQEVL